MIGKSDGLPADTWPPVIVCGQCDGLARTLDVCRCVQWGDRFLIDETEEVQPGTRPYQECELCHGTGYVSQSCDGCGQTGRLRVQLVLTVVNLDSGVVASTNVVPGGVEPQRDRAGRWELALTPLVADLATAARVTSWWDVRYPGQQTAEFNIPLPRGWTPDLPAAERWRLEAEALGRHCWLPWRIWLGNMMLPTPRDLGAELGRLCQLADLLCLDLVVEARRRTHGGLGWDIRYDLPGGEIPTMPYANGDDLLSTVAATTFKKAMSGLRERSQSAPAHYLRPHRSEQPPEPPAVDLDQLERRLHADLDGLGDAAGAQAIWRDGRWWHTRLKAADRIEVLTEQSTGQVVRREVINLRRTWEPPAPGWQGAAIPEAACPNCQSTCHTCQGSGRIQHGAVVTITDLRDQVVHLNWPSTEAPVVAPHVGNEPNGKPIHQLPRHYQLRYWAMLLQGRQEDLVELDWHHPLDQFLKEGIVTVDRADADPLRQYLVDISAGRPGGRLLVGLVPPPAPPIAELIRLAHGLHQAITLTMQDHRLNESDPRCIHGERWQIAMTPPSTPIDPNLIPYHLTPEAAAAHFMAYLENAVTTAVPADFDQAIPVPQTPRPLPLVEDPVPQIRRLARYHAGQPVSIRYEHRGCHLHVHEKDGALRHVATAPTLASALTALGLNKQK
ncbi:hypothetical protein ACWDV4_05645 [Micromonospora sp. NPDC003197]